MNERTAMLFRAIYSGDTALTEALLLEGQSPDSTRLGVSDSPKPALWWAGVAKRKDIFNLLLAHGADVHRYSSDAENGYPNLLGVTAWDVELSLTLIARGVDPHDFSRSGLNYMWYAAREPNLDLMRHLAAIGVEVDPDPMHDTPRGRHNQSIVHAAAQSFDTRFLDLAVELGGNIDTRNSLGMSALHAAAHHVTNRLPAYGTFRSMLERLLHHGLHVDVKDDCGNTPLHYAVGHTPYGARYASQPEIINALLDAGADPKLKNKRGARPVDLADKLGVMALRNYVGTTSSQGSADRGQS